MDFEKFAKDVILGINYSLNKANENLNQCTDNQVINDQEDLSRILISLLQNRCLDHIINIIGRQRNFSNNLSE